MGKDTAVKVHDRLPDLFAPDAVRSDEPETPCGVIQPLDVDLLRVREIDVVGQLERSVMAAGATSHVTSERGIQGGAPDATVTLVGLA